MQIVDTILAHMEHSVKNQWKGFSVWSTRLRCLYNHKSQFLTVLRLLEHVHAILKLFIPQNMDFSLGWNHHILMQISCWLKLQVGRKLSYNQPLRNLCNVQLYFSQFTQQCFETILEYCFAILLLWIMIIWDLDKALLTKIKNFQE